MDEFCAGSFFVESGVLKVGMHSVLNKFGGFITDVSFLKSQI